MGALDGRGEEKIDVSLSSLWWGCCAVLFTRGWGGGGEDDTNFSFFPISKLKIKTSFFFLH